MIDQELEELLKDEIGIMPYLGADGANVPQVGAEVPFPCHIDSRHEETEKTDGTMGITNHWITFGARVQVTGLLADGVTIGLRSIDRRDVPVMPTDFQIADPEIKEVLNSTDEIGDHHTSLVVGARRGSNA